MPSVKAPHLVPWTGVLFALALLACNGDGGSGQPAPATPSPSPAWSPAANATPSGQTADVSLAYTLEDSTRLFVRRHVLDVPAREEQEVPLPDGCEQVADLALAPGATKLALVCQSEAWPVYILDLSRLDYLKVAEHWGGGLRWSPDGLTLAYGVARPVDPRAPSDPVGIHLVSSDGTNDRELVPPRLWQEAGPWSPDGKSILITTCLFVGELRGHMWMTEQHWLEGQQQPRIVAQGVVPVDWTLRGGDALLGWHDSCPGGTERPQAWVVELPFGNSYAIAPPNLSPAGWLYSGDKAVLFWFRSRQTLAGEIWLADRDGQVERVLAVPDGIQDLELAPDRRSVLYVDWSEEAPAGTALYVWDVVQRGEPRLLGRGALANLSAAFDYSAD